MSARPEISEEELHAFIDGELDQAARLRIAETIARDATLSEKIAAFRADKTSLEQAYGPLIDRPLPAKWISRIEESTRPRRAVRLAPWAAIAAAVLIMIGGAVFFRQPAADGEESIVREAIAARSQTLEPDEVIAAASGAPAREIDGVMTASLKMRLKAPDLTRMGYRLASLRVYEDVPGGKSVELVYRGTGNRDVSLYVRRPTSAVRFDQFKRDGLRVCVWQDDVLGTVITGRMSAAEMQRIASLAYTGLET